MVKIQIDMDDPVTNSLLSSLRFEDETVTRAEAELDQARTAFRLAAVKYAAVRDMVTSHLAGYDPYHDVHGIQFMSGGKYRFLLMNVGDAIIRLLREEGNPMSLPEIVIRLNAGGLNAEPRAVNAALMRTAGVHKLEEGKYLLNEEEAEPLIGRAIFEREEDER